MSEEFLPHIFEPFSQESTDTTALYGGTGLGLAISKNIVDMMDGSIAVRSIKGIGTAFTVDVKLGITEEEKLRHNLKKRDYNFSHMRTLMVDDDVAVCESAVVTLHEMGVMAEWVDSGRKAVDRVRELWGGGKYYDMILIDWKMPEMDGITFVEHARTRLPDTAFIMLSQVSSKEMVSAAYEAGIEFFIQKPVNSIEVENVIQKVRQNLSMKRTLQKMQELFTEDIPGALPEEQAGSAETSADTQSLPSRNESMVTLQTILQRLGIIGDIGSRDIITVVEYMIQNHAKISELTLNELCSRFSDSPKSMEQRIRRTANAGLVNLAHLGIEDYGNEIFTEYANTLYNFEQVRREMDYIRGRSEQHGNVRVRRFLGGLLECCREA